MVCILEDCFYYEFTLKIKQTKNLTNRRSFTTSSQNLVKLNMLTTKLCNTES